MSEPSWVKVIGTTVRLWLQRRVLGHLPRGGSLFSSRRRLAAVIIFVIVVFAAGALTVVASGLTSTGPRPQPGRQAGRSPAVLAGAAADRQRAASWVAGQVSRSAIVACDAVMCTALAAAGFPAANLLTLGPQSPDPLGSEIVVSTAAVRSQFGSKLAAVYAPGVLASFGAGTAAVAVRVGAPDGAAAYARAMTADLSARRATGAQLLRNVRLRIFGRARSELAAGQVDSRLLATLVSLTASYRVRVLGFGPPQPGASPGVPLRSVEITVRPASGRRGRSRLLPAVLKSLRAQIPPFHAANIVAARAAGEPVLHIEFAAPSPPGLLSQGAAK